MPAPLGEQPPLPGLGGYLLLCAFRCLTDCPSPEDCIYDDPGMDFGSRVEYSEFEVWRWNHEGLVCEEPVGPFTSRCPRCLSTKVTLKYPHMFCSHCGYSEPLIDFSENVGRGVSDVSFSLT